MTAAVIQPYFIPYAGYFRLFAAADVVVMFDCVQFPRRGWVHRNRLPLATGELDWFTLPVARSTRDTVIGDVALTRDAGERIRTEARRFPLIARALQRKDPLAERVVAPASADMTMYLIDRLTDCTGRLGLDRPIVRSSTLAIDPALHAQDRVIAILRALDATSYVNPSGGRELYDHASFASAGIELGFLSTYGSSMESILGRILEGSPEEIAAEIRRETIIER